MNAETYRLPNGELIDAECLTGAVASDDEPLPTWQEWRDWQRALCAKGQQ